MPPEVKAITQDREIRSGVPCITGTRFPLSRLLAEMLGGRGLRDVCEDFSQDYGKAANALNELARFVDDPFSLQPKVDQHTEQPVDWPTEPGWWWMDRPGCKPTLVNLFPGVEYVRIVSIFKWTRQECNESGTRFLPAHAPTFPPRET